MLEKYACEPELDDEIFKQLQEALDNDDKNALTKFFADKSSVEIKNCRWHILLSLDSDYIHKLSVYDDYNNRNKPKEIHISSSCIENMPLEQIIRICKSKAIVRIDKKTCSGLQERLCFGILEDDNKQSFCREVLGALMNATFKNKNFDLQTTESFVNNYGSKTQIEAINEFGTQRNLTTEKKHDKNESQTVVNEIKKRVSASKVEKVSQM